MRRFNHDLCGGKSVIFRAGNGCCPYLGYFNVANSNTRATIQAKHHNNVHQPLRYTCGRIFFCRVVWLISKWGGKLLGRIHVTVCRVGRFCPRVRNFPHSTRGQTSTTGISHSKLINQLELLIAHPIKIHENRLLYSRFLHQFSPHLISMLWEPPRIRLAEA